MGNEDLSAVYSLLRLAAILSRARRLDAGPAGPVQPTVRLSNRLTGKRHELNFITRAVVMDMHDGSDISGG